MTNTVTAPRYAATACWQNGCADRAVTITRDGQPIALVPLADTGEQPSMATLDGLLEVLGFTRTSKWLPADRGLVCDVTSIRPEG